MIDPLKLETWRRKCADGTITKTELAEAYAALRESRASIPVATGGSKTKAGKAKTPINSDDLLAGLGDLP